MRTVAGPLPPNAVRAVIMRDTIGSRLWRTCLSTRKLLVCSRCLESVRAGLPYGTCTWSTSPGWTAARASRMPSIAAAICRYRRLTVRMTTTPIVKRPRFCWNCSRRSAVSSTSNLFLRTRQKLAVREAGPVLFLNRSDGEFRQIAARLARQVLVQQYAFQAMRASSARPASSRNAIACSRDTLGKSSRNSSMVSPPSR